MGGMGGMGGMSGMNMGGMGAQMGGKSSGGKKTYYTANGDEF